MVKREPTKCECEIGTNGVVPYVPQYYIVRCDWCKNLEAEVERLKIEYEQLLQSNIHWREQIDYLQGVLAKKKAEVERLRSLVAMLNTRITEPVDVEIWTDTGASDDTSQ